MKTLNFKPEGWKNIIIKVENGNIDTYIKSGSILQGIVEKCDDKCNLHIKLNNDLTGIIPKQEVEGINVGLNGTVKENLCTGKVNKFVQFKVKGIQDENIVLLSRKDVQQEILNCIKKEVEVGQKIQGVVKNIQPYGVFVEIAGGVVGLLNIEDISVSRIKNPTERFKIGQIIDIVVKSMSIQTGRLFFSHKEILGTWEKNIKKYKQGMNVNGIIRETEKNKNGIFVELEPNLVGLVEYEEGFEYGDNVRVYIKKIDNERKKIKLLIVN